MTRQRTKLLGPILLAVIAAMAASAAAAQANYDLLRNGQSVNTLQLTGAGLLGKLLTEGEINVHCGGATFSGTATKVGGGTSINMTVNVLFEGCSVIDNPFCIIGSLEDALDGHKTASFSGAVLGHSGGNYFGLGLEHPITVVYFNGPFCTLPVEEEVSGSIAVTILNAEANTTEHLMHIDENELFFGETAGDLEEGLAHVEEADGATFSIRLVGL